MLYNDFISKVKDEVLMEADNSLWYVDPDWRHILYLLDLNVDNISDYKTDLQEIENVLKLEVEKRNTILSLNPAITSWFYSLITSTVEPAILQEETNYIQKVLEYLKANKNQ